MMEDLKRLDKLLPNEWEALSRLKVLIYQEQISKEFMGIIDLEEVKDLVVQSYKITLEQLHHVGISGLTLDKINRKIFGNEAKYLKIWGKLTRPALIFPRFESDFLLFA